MATLKNLPKICPSCGKRLSVHAMHCNGCQTHIEGNYSLPVMMQLSAPDQQFVLDFVKSSGSLKEMAHKLGLINSKAMNKILNPFEYLSTGKALGWGLAGTLFSICLLTAVSWPVEGDVSKIITILSSNLLLWLPLSLLLYVMALVLSPSRIRAVDIFATNLFAMLPTIVILGVLSLCSMWLGSIVCEPRSACEVLKQAAYNLIVIVLSVSMVWSMVWGCFAYLVSANMKGWKSIVVFVICYVFVSVVNQLLIEYTK